jgi:hypothetical protein
LHLFILAILMLIGGGDCQELAERSPVMPAAGVTRVAAALIFRWV